MRREMQSLAAMVQHNFSSAPLAGDLWILTLDQVRSAKAPYHGPTSVTDGRSRYPSLAGKPSAADIRSFQP
jgi:hypothetical protein